MKKVQMKRKLIDFYATFQDRKFEQFFLADYSEYIKKTFEISRKNYIELNKSGSHSNPDGIITTKHIIMENEGSSKRSRPSILQRSSLKSSSVMSLERFSLPRNTSLSRKVSLISAMDLQISQHSSKSDYFGERDPNRLSDNQRESVVYEYKIEVEEKDLNRKSQFKISHQCDCSNGCLAVHCICFLTPREICVIGQCCSQCIASKNYYLQTVRGFQLEETRRQRKIAQQESNPLYSMKQKNYRNMHYYKHTHAEDPLVKDFNFCTCKKSHCQKKYCICFYKGIKCGDMCICIGCKNMDEEAALLEEQQQRWERYATYKAYEQNEQPKAIEGNIEQFLQKQQENEDGLNFTMQFQPVNFDRILYQGYQ